MILSHRHSAIFVKTIKVAGTSVELALSSVCGRRDVITPINPDEPELRADLGGREPQNYVLRSRMLRATPQHLLPTRPLREPERQLVNHTPARVIRELVGETTWRRYFTFTIDRNPWDRAVSLFHFDRFLGHVDRTTTFADWLALQPDERLSNFPLYADGDEVIVDRILRYERLAGEIGSVAAHLGVELPPLPRAKSGIRPSSDRDWRALYGEAEQARIAAVCHREIELLGYTFEDERPTV